MAGDWKWRTETGIYYCCLNAGRLLKKRRCHCESPERAMSRQIVFCKVETWYKGRIGAKHPINWKFIGNYTCYLSRIITSWASSPSGLQLGGCHKKFRPCISLRHKLFTKFLSCVAMKKRHVALYNIEVLVALG